VDTGIDDLERAYRNQYLQCKGLLMFCATCFVTSSDVGQGSTGWERQLLGGLCPTLGEDRHFKMRPVFSLLFLFPFFGCVFSLWQAGGDHAVPQRHVGGK
jgi:hypothetical protein